MYVHTLHSVFKILTQSALAKKMLEHTLLVELMQEGEYHWKGLPSFFLFSCKFSVVKKGNAVSLLSSHLIFLLSYNLLSSQGLIFKLPENLVTPTPYRY